MEAKILMLKGEKGDPGGSTWGNISGTLSNQTDLNTVLNNKAAVSDLGAAAFSNDYSDLSNTPALKTVATTGSYNDLTNKPNFADVALTGSYSDLSEKPTQITDLTGVLPLSRGGTGATTAAGARTALEVMKRYVLYENPEGSTGSFNLNDDVKNYELLEIHYSPSNDVLDKNSRNCVKFFDTLDGRITGSVPCCLDSLVRVYSGGTAQFKIGFNILTFQKTGTTQTGSFDTSTCFVLNINTSSTTTVTGIELERPTYDEPFAKVYKVFGYKY